jgi:hypothetical protein
LEENLENARIDEYGRLIEPAIYGKQRLNGNRQDTIERIVRITNQNGKYVYLRNFPIGRQLPKKTKAVEVFYNFIPDTCEIRFDIGAINNEEEYLRSVAATSPLVTGIRSEVGIGYHIERFSLTYRLKEIFNTNASSVLLTAALI